MFARGARSLCEDFCGEKYCPDAVRLESRSCTIFSRSNSFDANVGFCVDDSVFTGRKPLVGLGSRRERCEESMLGDFCVCESKLKVQAASSLCLNIDVSSPMRLHRRKLALFSYSSNVFNRPDHILNSTHRGLSN